LLDSTLFSFRAAVFTFHSDLLRFDGDLCTAAWQTHVEFEWSLLVKLLDSFGGILGFVHFIGLGIEYIAPYISNSCICFFNIHFNNLYRNIIFYHFN